MNEILAAIFSGIAISIVFIWRVNSAHKRRKERIHQEIRDTVCAERNKQLQAAKDKGDFDIWNPND